MDQGIFLRGLASAFLFFSISLLHAELRLIPTPKNFERLGSEGHGSDVFLGDPHEKLNSRCSLWELKKSIRTGRWKLSNTDQFLDSFYNRCAPLKTFYTPLTTSIQDLNFRYDYQQRSQFRELWFEDTVDGTRLRSQLILQEGSNARPLVIVKCGIMCDLGGNTHRRSIMKFYDEGPFHVLLLGNITGREFSYDNQTFSLGGFEEGRHFYQLASFFKNDPRFRHHINEVHVVGFSLGGHGALYSGIYNTASNDKPISSIISGCGVVNLKSSVNSVFRHEIVGPYFYHKFINQLEYLGDSVESLLSMFHLFQSRPKRRELPRLSSEAAFKRLSRLNANPAWNLPPFKSNSMRNIDDFWNLNDYTRFARHNKTNTFLWSPEDDPVVRHRENSRKIQALNTENHHFLISDKGGHCNFAGSIGWSQSAEIFRNYLIMNSPSLKDRLQYVSLDLSEWLYNPQDNKAPRRGRVSAAQWETGINYARIRFDIRQKKSRVPFKTASATFYETEYKYLYVLLRPLASLLKTSFPKNDVERQAFTRRLNSQLELKLAGNKQLIKAIHLQQYR